MVSWLLLACAGVGDLANTGEPETQVLTVLAASSLTDAMADLEQAFEAAHPDVDVVLAVAGSQALATQVRHGIQADVFASADEQHLAALAAEGLVQQPRLFARNSLVLAVSDRLEQPVDLERLPAVGSLVVGDDQVPVGRYTADLLDAAQDRHGEPWRQQVEARIVSREPNVRLVAAKLALGEADAAIVYQTDLAATPGVQVVALPPDLAPSARYFHAALASPPQPELAQAWLALVESPAGQAVLGARGFEPR